MQSKILKKQSEMVVDFLFDILEKQISSHEKETKDLTTAD